MLSDIFFDHVWPVSPSNIRLDFHAGIADP